VGDYYRECQPFFRTAGSVAGYKERGVEGKKTGLPFRFRERKIVGRPEAGWAWTATVQKREKEI
jgi:hypothetical protein